MVEHDLAKVGVAGSNPVSRSQSLKRVHGSNPVSRSNKTHRLVGFLAIQATFGYCVVLSPGSDGGIGRHAGLKILWALARAGSSPAPSTKARVSVSVRAQT